MPMSANAQAFEDGTVSGDMERVEIVSRAAWEFGEQYNVESGLSRSIPGNS